MLIFYLWLLMLGGVRAVHFETITVDVHQNVTLTCARPEDSINTMFFWIRIVSGHWPEFLGGTYSFDDKRNDKTVGHITTKQESKTFILHVNGIKVNDTGLYYCVEVDELNLTFVMGRFVKVKETDQDQSSLIQEPHSVHPGVQTPVQCSLLSHPGKKMCNQHLAVYWFHSGPHESHPNFIYTHNDGDGNCSSSLETPSAQRCVYSFSRSFSDAGVYHCAVAACGQILLGQGTQQNTEDLHKKNQIITALCLLCTALSVTVVVLLCGVCSMKRKTSTGVCFGNKSASNDSQSIQTLENSLVYSAPTFSRRKHGKAVQRNAEFLNQETVYSDVRVSE